MKLKIVLSTLFLISGLGSYAQNNKIKKAEKEYEQLAYIDAIKIYENVAKKGYKSADLFQKLGNAYYFNAELPQANHWYTELFSLKQTLDPEYYYRYSQTLKSVGDYDNANKMLDAFNIKNSNDSRAKLYESNKDYYAKIQENSGRYTIHNIEINSELSDYGTSFFKDQIVFASSRERRGVTKHIQKWNNQAFSTLYTAKIDANDNLEKPQPFSSTIDSKFNEATPVFTKDGQTVYFTRNNYNNGKKGKNAEGTILLKLYKATLENDKWVNVKELPFNSDDFSTAHPALSPDEKTLYFASNRPGTLGESDIYKVAIYGNDSYGNPENLGNTINTEGKETFPFISAENELYFSSNGHPGLGGLDVFVAKMNPRGSFEKPNNVGMPINGPMDDFAFIINTNTNTGYFSSNREGGKGYDDIYSFTETKKLEYNQLIAGTVIDKDTQGFLAGAKVIVLDENRNVIKEVLTDNNGKFIYDEAESGKTYYIRVSKDEYLTEEQKQYITSENGKIDVKIALEKNIKKLTPGTDLAKIFAIERIYFDLDKSDIRPDAALDISKVIAVLNQYPTMKLQITSHTDSRASKSYNLMLSQKRAQSTLDFMVKSGIAKNRLTAKGYGENQLVNKCADGVACSEEEHQQNRRSEFIITAM
ncbi:OmpA family protein [Flavobacterium hydatis]|uniref:Flagellar motor protein MotB n=1 Tax=Flavobacterium hydatis TaxID=991 RepID=A0A086A414_FLAHY|nr:OmpA family protein [Flavobacterium hydatis]KFF11428.1 flagellar motor protein MotB [Flavobacterium hydatis]OXA95846.1 flagellar motor protein MotB [Flavobacterium hydatis]